MTGTARTVKPPVPRATGVPMATEEITVLPLDRLVSRDYRLAEINEAYANLASGQDLRGLILFDEEAA